MKKNGWKLQGDVCLSVQNLKSAFIDRSTLEIDIMCRAFAEFGYTLTFEFVAVPNEQRALRYFSTGQVDGFASTIWARNIQEELVYSTVDVLREGEFEKGIYVHEGHELLSKPIAEIDLKQYSAATYLTWNLDLQVLESLTNNVHKLSDSVSKLQLLDHERVDFTLMEFPQSSDLQVHNKGYRLLPIPGIKVVIPGSRRFVISKKTANAKEIFTLLNKGLKQLHERNEIYNMYARDGFINPTTKNWKILN